MARLGLHEEEHDETKLAALEHASAPAPLAVLFAAPAEAMPAEAAMAVAARAVAASPLRDGALRDSKPRSPWKAGRAAPAEALAFPLFVGAALATVALAGAIRHGRALGYPILH